MARNKVIANYYSIVEPTKLPSVLEPEYPATLNAYLKVANERILVVGQTTQPSAVKIVHIDRNSLAVKLNIGAIKKLFQMPAEALTDQVVFLDDLATEYSEAIILESLNKYDRFNWKMGVFEQTFSQTGEQGYIDAILETICKGLVRTVKELAALTGYSERQLQRVMLAYTGVTTKQFLELLRFEKSRVLIEERPKQIALASLAYENDYFDQPHLIKDFKRYSGYSPERYRMKMSDLSNP